MSSFTIADVDHLGSTPSIVDTCLELISGAYVLQMCPYFRGWVIYNCQGICTQSLMVSISKIAKVATFKDQIILF